MGRPTREDVARLVDVSGATVSRVLSGRSDIPIAPETRQKVIEAAKQLGYMPNAAARALNNVPTGLIGFWMSLHYSRYRGQVLDEMRSILGRTEMALSVTDVDEEYQWDHNFSRALRVSVDGIIAFDSSVSLNTFAAQRDHVAPATPFVSMGAIWSERLSFVGVDLRAGAKLAMNHLLNTGHRRIAFLVPGHSSLDSQGPRFEVYRDGMEGAGLPMQQILTRHVEVTEIMDALNGFKEKGELPDAILCMNDDLALSASTALYKLGMRPGHDIALVGFDGIKESEHALCPITTVRQPMQEMCELAIDFLRSQIENPSAPLKQRLLVPELVIRESSRP
jgi:DNA-binding LacI/PurR family transcriptional regulator